MKTNKVNNRSRAVPLYSLAETMIRNRILTGQLEPGDRLPSEDELSVQFGVSKITIRTALSNLRNEGFIVRNRPKGTFVAEQIPIQKQFTITGDLYDLLKNAAKYEVKPIGIQTLEVSQTRIAGKIREFFNLTNLDTINVLQRVRLLRGIPIYFIENFTSAEILQHVTLEELSKKPFLEILKDKIGLKIGDGEIYIEAVAADLDVAEALNIQLFDPLILTQCYYRLPSGDPFEIVNQFVRSEYFKYKVALDPKRF